MLKLNELIKSDKAGRWIFIIGIFGIALIFLSTVFDGGTGKSTSAANAQTSDEYSEILEKKIFGIVSSITGDKNVTVAVTLESGSEYVYANNTNKSTDLAETQNDSQTTVKQNDSTEEQYIIIDSGDGESALVVTEKLPRIRGVVIVASGADNEQIRQAIVNSVTTALDISSRKVYVTNAN